MLPAAAAGLAIWISLFAACGLACSKVLQLYAAGNEGHLKAGSAGFCGANISGSL
ncbi:hypothetical protein EIKCOROL_00115 [Eikenella corrodens ATCC 23834]|uniref:Uncharacterized protein n=1 Tax=Eikenella corrodens ATCC 23834 TaxID=546274 RepID=C0DRZ9_EIKCO|nr:hypothetical protein EIKCOROL_00115 [Eikenella corrodens ATCC 23834]